MSSRETALISREVASILALEPTYSDNKIGKYAMNLRARNPETGEVHFNNRTSVIRYSPNDQSDPFNQTMERITSEIYGHILNGDEPFDPEHAQQQMSRANKIERTDEDVQARDYWQSRLLGKEIYDLLQKPSWSREDRMTYESTMAEWIGKETHAEWGEYSLAKRLPEGTLSEIYATGEWECEMQSMTEGLILQRLEDTLLEDPSDGRAGWKVALPYYYVSGEVQYNADPQNYDGGGHAWLATPTGNIIEATMGRFNPYRRTYSDSARSKPISLQHQLEEEGMVFTHKFTDTSQTSIYLPRTEQQFARGFEYRQDIDLNSPYMQFFPEQHINLSLKIAANGLVPMSSDYEHLSFALGTLRFSGILDGNGEFIQTLRDAVSDGHVSREEEKALNTILDGIDNDYRHGPRDIDGFNSNNKEDNFTLRVDNPGWFGGKLKVELGFDSGIESDAIYEQRLEYEGVSRLAKIAAGANINQNDLTENARLDLLEVINNPHRLEAIEVASDAMPSNNALPASPLDSEIQSPDR